MLWIVAGVVAVVLVLVVAYFTLFDRRSAVEVMNAEDGDDKLKRWSRGCYSIVVGKHDPAKNGKAGCSMVLRRDWDVGSAAEEKTLIGKLREVPSGEPSWDLVRALVLTRFAVGAELLSAPAAARYAGQIQSALRQAFSDWRAVADAYAVARKAEFDDDDFQLEMAREDAETLWAVVPFN